jgi:NADPH:quinone reductase-like Zn-dependent oxidoreductase
VRGFGINHSEIFTREGKSPSVVFPRILGIEAVGEIVDSPSRAFHAGQKVLSIMGEMGRAFDGSYAQYVLIPDEQIYCVESTLSWENLAAIPETFYTAYGAVKGLRIDPEERSQRVLIRSAAGSVGVAVAKLIRALAPNAYLIGTTRSPQKVQRLRGVGFDEILVCPKAEVLPADMPDVDRILDIVGPAAIRDSLHHLARNGIVSSTGQLGGVWTLNNFDPITAIPNGRYLTSFYSGDVTESQIQEMFDVIERKQIEVKPVKVFALSEIQEAHRFLESEQGWGKVVVIPE